MNKDLIYKFFSNKANSQEIEDIIGWVEKSPDNLQFFAQQKAMWDLSGRELEDSILLENGHKAKKSRKKLYRIAYFSSVAILAILLTINIFIKEEVGVNSIINKNVSANSLTVQLHPETIRTLYTEKGVKATIMLPDSSMVWLNSDSKITYPAVFDEKQRNVEISGEAYFEVKHDSLRPMLVKTNKDFSVEVLGTKFLVRSYDNDNSAKTVLYSGAVTMHYAIGKNKTLCERKLKPLESFTYYTQAKQSPKLSSSINNKDIAWKNGELIFEQTPMDEVLKMLERWHGTKFIVKNNKIYNDKLSASFQTESIVQIMEMVKFCIDMDYDINNNVVTIR